MNNTLPAARKTVREYEQAVKQAKEHYANAIKLAKLGNQCLNEIGEHLEPHFFSKYNLPEAENINSEIDRKAWRKLISVTGFSQIFDAVAMDAFDKALDNNPPEFTEANALATIERLSADAGMMFSRGLVSIFKRLSGEYKSHSAFKVQKKMIIKNLRGWSGVAHDKTDMINDLDRVLCGLTSREYKPYALVGNLTNAIQKHGGEYEDSYISCKFFMNGNAHIVIKEQGLIDRINDIIADWYGGGLAAA